MTPESKFTLMWWGGIAVIAAFIKYRQSRKNRNNPGAEQMNLGDKYSTEYGPSIVTEINHNTFEFTVQMQNVYGGANPRTPIADDDLYRTYRFCPDCGEPCQVVPLDNSFDYAGTHCTNGAIGTHKPAGYGDPVSDCCEAPINQERLEP